MSKPIQIAHPWCRHAINLFFYLTLIVGLPVIFNTSLGLLLDNSFYYLGVMAPEEAINFILYALTLFILKNESRSIILSCVGTLIALFIICIAVKLFVLDRTSLSEMINFILMGAGLFVGAWIPKPRYWLFVIGLAIFTLAMLSMFQYAYMVNSNYYPSLITRMTPISTILFLMAGLILPFIRPNEKFISMLLGESVAGKYSRLAIMFIVFIPFVISYLENIGEQYQLYNPDFGDSVLTTVTTLILMMIIFWGAKKITDEEEMKRASENEIAFLDKHDPDLTILNIKGFEQKLNALIDQDNKSLIAVLKLDINRMDILSHTMGNDERIQLLRQLLARFQNHIQQKEVIIGMTNKNQFGFIMTNIPNINDISALANSLLGKLSEVCLINGKETILTGSIGVSVFPADGSTAQSLLDGASLALTQAVKEYANSYFFCTPYLINKLSERLEIEKDLEVAITDNQLLLYYHPQLNLATGKFAGAETLLRWMHPKKGLVMPGAFIAIAEESDLIIPIGEWIFHESCRQINAGWPFAPSMGKEDLVTLSVNVSAKQFNTNYPMVSIFEEYLKKYQINPALIEIEITESLFMQDTSYKLKQLLELKKRGFSIAIDDFGTGFSSFNYLSQLPNDIIKVDKSFIDRIVLTKNDAALVRAIIAMSHELGKKVIAEGVETKEQLELLKQMHCDFIQGNYYSVPLSLEEFKIFIRK